MKLLSPSIKSQVIRHEFFEVVSNQKMFGFDANITDDVLEKLSLNLYKPDEIVCEQGTYPDEMYFLCRGTCDIFKVFDQEQPYFVGCLEAGSMFGEIAAVMHCPSTATVKCKNYCTVAGLDTEAYFMIAMRYPKLSEKMIAHVITSYKDPVTNFFLKRYHRVDYLRKLDKRIGEELSYHLKVKICQYGQVIIEPGQECNSMFIVVKGVVQIFLKSGQDEIVTDYLGKGSIIG